MSGQRFRAVSFLTFENSFEMHFCADKQQWLSQGWISHCMWFSLKWSLGAPLSPLWSWLKMNSPRLWDLGPKSALAACTCEVAWRWSCCAPGTRHHIWTPSNEVSCCAKSICSMLWKASKCSTNEEYWTGNTNDCTPPYLIWQRRHSCLFIISYVLVTIAVFFVELSLKIFLFKKYSAAVTV